MRQTRDPCVLLMSDWQSKFWAYISSDEALYRGHCLSMKLAMSEKHVPCFL